MPMKEHVPECQSIITGNAVFFRDSAHYGQDMAYLLFKIAAKPRFPADLNRPSKAIQNP